MSINSQLESRSNNVCELCSSADENLVAYTVPPKTDDSIDHQVVLCKNCFSQISESNYTDTNNWRCLTGSIWSEVSAVQALSYKLLNKLSGEDWATETLETVFLEEAVIAWANAEDRLASQKIIHKDSSGVVLQTGDTVILTQNLNIKGANFNAVKGTIVRKIWLVPDNEEQIEGKIDGQNIVILTKYLRKTE